LLDTPRCRIASSAARSAPRTIRTPPARTTVVAIAPFQAGGLPITRSATLRLATPLRLRLTRSILAETFAARCSAPRLPIGVPRRAFS
jgi:hypothetical protein